VEPRGLGETTRSAAYRSLRTERAEICLKSNLPARAQDGAWGHILMMAAAAVTSQSGSDPLRLALLWSGTDAAAHPIRDGVVLIEARENCGGGNQGRCPRATRGQNPELRRLTLSQGFWKPGPSHGAEVAGGKS